MRISHGVRYFPLVKDSERFTPRKEDKSFPLLKNRGFPWSKTLKGFPLAKDSERFTI
jgi:hypothetical protein